MKIIDLTEFFSERGGGVRTHLELKGRVLRNRGHRHLVIAPGPQRGPPVEGLMRIGGPRFPYDSSYHLFLRIDRVLKAIESEQPDILEVHSPYLAMASALLASRKCFAVRTFCWHADFVDTYLRPVLEKHLSSAVASGVLRPAWALVRELTSRCDGTIVASAQQLAKLRHRNVPHLHRIPFGVDKTTFRPEAADARVRKKFLGEASNSTLLVVAAGRFSYEKRFDVVIDAFRRLRGKRRAVLLLLGDGPERVRLESRASRLDVHFLGFEKDRSRLASIFASSDVFLHGCPYETCGLTIAEARSCGVPVVVPDQGAASEEIDLACAEIYRSGCPEACAAATERLLSRDGRALRARARTGAAAVFSVEQHFDALLDVYQRLLDDKWHQIRSDAGGGRTNACTYLGP
ncbi:MAG TPA: glycosyltransferase [Anaeromyxobacteraceae bacterium]|nr:glycosyltransferase [Anaeromyxobacteraceae bacterium]